MLACALEGGERPLIFSVWFEKVSRGYWDRCVVLVQDWDRVRKSRRCGSSFFGFNKFQRRDLWFTAFEGYCKLHFQGFVGWFFVIDF